VLRKINFLSQKNLRVDSKQTVALVESDYSNTGMCKSESFQSHESRAQSVDSSEL